MKCSRCNKIIPANERLETRTTCLACRSTYFKNWRKRHKKLQGGSDRIMTGNTNAIPIYPHMHFGSELDTFTSIII